MVRYRKAIFITTYARQKPKVLATLSKHGRSKTKNDFEYLILRRRLHWKGWEFPKGEIKFSETERKAVIRELKEETGLSPLKIKKFNFSGKYNYDKMFPDRPDFKGQKFSLYAAEIKKAKVKFDKYEHSGYKWVGFEKAIKMLKWPNQRKSLRIVSKWLKEKSQKA